MTPVLGNLHLHLSYLCLVAHRAFGFCNKYFFPREGYQPSAQPPTWRASEITLRLAPTFHLFGMGVPPGEQDSSQHSSRGHWGTKAAPPRQSDNPNRGSVLENTGT